jgi:hypothetical protein
MTDWTALLSSPIVVVLALVIGTFGEVSKRLVRAKAGDKGWKGVYYVTLPAHPVVAGILFGLVPWLPIPDGLVKEGHEFAGRLGTGALAGIACKIGYDGIVSTAKRYMGNAGSAAQRAPEPAPLPVTNPPPAPDEEPAEPPSNPETPV